MRRLVDDLLDLARLEAGEVTLAREPVDMREVLRACASRFAPQANNAGVYLEVDAPDPLREVAGDADRLGQAFGNLVDNALKHAGNEGGGGRVVLQAEDQQALVVCSVTDNGPGIPSEDLPRIFERFYQVDKSRVRRASGAGLGLAIAKEIVQAHGGLIDVESVEGLGTRFTVRLPANAG
jgi:two-component system sensor histidine kinase ResE